MCLYVICVLLRITLTGVPTCSKVKHRQAASTKDPSYLPPQYKQSNEQPAITIIFLVDTRCCLLLPFVEFSSSLKGEAKVVTVHAIATSTPE